MLIHTNTSVLTSSKRGAEGGLECGRGGGPMEDTMEGLEGGGGPMEEMEEDLVGGGPGLAGMLFPQELEDGSSILFRSKLICD